MGITIYAYSVDPFASRVTGLGNSIENVAEELRKVRAEIALEDGYEVPTSEVSMHTIYIARISTSSSRS